MLKDKRYLAARVGNLEQIVYARKSVMSDGKSDGMRVIEINNGNGLSCTLLENRCLDIARLSYNGTNIGFLAKGGLTAPSQCTAVPGEFLYYFQGGMLYTCGLLNVGPNKEKNGKILLQHGRIALTPAQEVNTEVDWDKGEIRISGRTTQASLFGENLELSRKITIPMTENNINIEDTITNNGFANANVMLLYHFNFGYPMLSEDLKLKINGTVKPRDEIAASGINKWNSFEAPTAGRPEEVFYHTPDSENDGYVHAQLTNNKLNIGAELVFDKKQLPQLVQWKSMASGDYALGIEPGTTLVEGYDNEVKEGRLLPLSAGEKKTFNVSLALFDLK